MNILHPAYIMGGSILSAVTYLLMLSQAPYAWQFLAKALPIILLGIWVISLPVVSMRGWLLLAIALSACGDVLLALPFDGHFEFGLGAFLLSHVAYIRIMLARGATKPTPWFTWSMLGFLLSGLGYVILTRTGEHTLAVTLYMLVISTMALLALKTYERSIIIGALLFLLSDSLIAINKFVVLVPFESLLIMSTYYLAQYFLITGLTRSSQDRGG